MRLRPSAALLAALALPACYEGWSRDSGSFPDDDASAPFPGDDDSSASPADDDDGSPTGSTDSDGDGSPDSLDCSDLDPAVYPGAPETCNGQDDDCDLAIDEGTLHNWYDDADGDGYGDPATLLTACAGGEGQIGIGGDCDDGDPAIHPGSALQVDGQDSDCDGDRDWLVQVWISVDDAFEWCMDDEDSILGSGSDWTQGYLFELWRDSGPHVVGIKGWDLYTVITAGIAHVQISDGSTWVSDAGWTFDPDPWDDPETRAGWCAPGFDDSGWQAVNVIGPIGTSPWGGAPYAFPAGSPAQWIWDYYPVNLNTQYLRKEIVLP